MTDFWRQAVQNPTFLETEAALGVGPMRFPHERARLAEACLLLNAIQADPKRLAAVLALQRMLIRRIAQCERRVSRLRLARSKGKRMMASSRLPKDEARLLRAGIAAIDSRIREIRQLMFLWRCFGDGIASVYQSQQALKHLLYDSEHRIKQDAGTISGKAGLRLEYRALCLGIRMGVPVVLCDLTNIIRHGDVCALAGEDPVPVEFKSSRARGPRAQRQHSQLQELGDFYANDGASSFRGLINFKRIALDLTSTRYHKDINACVTRAFDDGMASVAPELGLRYIACRPAADLEERLAAAVASYSQPQMLAVQLTPSPNWLPAYPFTLSLSPANSWLFMQGLVTIVVLVDMAIVKSLFASKGMHVIVLMDGDHALQMCYDPADLMKGAYRVSEQRFLRIACEFESLKSFVDETMHLINGARAKLDAIGPDSLGLITEPPKDWEHARDCFPCEPSTPDD
ncbi:hypothetical protein ABFG95_07875 [Achromobacter sp. HNDS-1]|uniref:Uncharacterized protein n=1 Tax=Achromobacter sp. HNDS-1 TaxID=3151598 RepID=A0AAU7LEP6_9BURK